MLILRILGWLLILAGSTIPVASLVLVFSGGSFTEIAGEVWFRISPDSQNLAQVFVQRHVWAPLWDKGIVTLLLMPLWQATGLATLFVAGPGLILTMKTPDR